MHHLDGLVMAQILLFYLRFSFNSQHSETLLFIMQGGDNKIGTSLAMNLTAT